MKRFSVLCFLPVMIVLVVTILLIEIISFLPYIEGTVIYNLDSTDPKKDVDLFKHIIKPSTQSISSWTLKKWSETDFLVVFGIPSEDIPDRRRRRDLQREYCWSYDGVATLKNNYTGAMIVLYVMGQGPSNQFKYSTALKAEAHAWQDILALPIREGIKLTSKQIGGGGFWGIDAEIGMSRKTFLWFYLALQIFPKALHVAKGDDDIFIRVPEYLRTLRMLPQKGIYWGLVLDRIPFTFDAVTHDDYAFAYANGPCMTLAKDVVEKFLSYKPLHSMIFLPYKKIRLKKFRRFAMHHEDVMVGLALHNSAYPGIVYVREPYRRFHNVHTGVPIYPVTSTSVVIHHVRENEYKSLREFFRTKGVFSKVFMSRMEFEIYIICR